MTIKKKTSTTRLPQNLLEEINESAGNSLTPVSRPSRFRVSRKEARKQERTFQKQKKAQFFSHSSNVDLRKRNAEERLDSFQRKKTRYSDEDTTMLNKTNASSRTHKLSTENANVSAQTPPDTTRIIFRKHGTNKTGRRELEDDKYIAYLESKLGYGKGKKKKKSDNDGLDDLFDWADSFALPSSPESESGDIDGSLSEMSIVTDISNDIQDEDDEDWAGIGDDQIEGGEVVDKKGVGEAVSKLTSGSLPAPYVPPHLRYKAIDETDSVGRIKLTRQLKGLLNRMSEQNLATILDSIEEIYRNHRRNDVTSTITTLIVDGITSHSSLLDSYVVLHAAFVSSLHKILGIEFAAHFVQAVIATYEQYLNESETSPTGAGSSLSLEADSQVPGKECTNLVVLISELYNFQVISAILVFDIIRSLLIGNLTELKVELLLKTLRNSGQQLRQDDPLALKDIIHIVQSKVPDETDTISSRTRFMLETLTNLKNNKLKRNVTQNQGGEAVERMKKFLTGLGKKRHVLAHEPLRVSLEDLHLAESKGKWWLVGAAWGGDPLAEEQKTTAEKDATKDPEDDLLMLARKQGMNTDIRRSIFVVLMSSDDYVDACERLSQLSLTEIQQREIVRVLLHCCGNEKTYNPYYTLTCQHLCRTSHSYKITLQFCLWDFLRDLGETSVGGAAVLKNASDHDSFHIKDLSKSRVRNVAKAYAWWIAKDCVNLSILKPVDFTSLKPQTKGFFRGMLIDMFIASQTVTPLITANFKDLQITRNRNTIEEIFVKASRIQALAMGLVYFISENIQSATFDDEEMAKFVRWAASLAKDILKTEVDVTTL